jgi:ABC-type multidrug transport system fused ATPase/permease subunit
LFGKQYNKRLYEKVVKLSCLKGDLKNMKDKDQTRVQQKGKNLSGGQRARLSLARALYSNSDIYLFDDPLSTFDHKTTMKVFVETIQKHLRGKTRIMVINQIELLDQFDLIYLMENGRIVAKGSYQVVKEHPAFEDLVLNPGQESQSASSRLNSISSLVKKKKLKKNKRSYLVDSDGKIRHQSILNMTSPAQSSFFLIMNYMLRILDGKKALIYLLNLVVYIWVKISSTTLLKRWKDKEKSPGLREFLKIYGVLNILLCLTTWLRYKLIFDGHLKFLEEFNKKISEKLLKGSFAKFYNKIRISDLTSILSNDMSSVDMKIPEHTVRFTLLM